MKKIFSILLSLVLACSLCLVTAAPVAAQESNGDVTIVVQDQAGNPIVGATASLLFYGAGRGGTPCPIVLSTDGNGIAFFSAEHIAIWIIGVTNPAFNTQEQIYIQPRATVDTGPAYGKVRTVNPVDGFPIIPYNDPNVSLVPLPAMSFTYNMILMSTDPVQTLWTETEFTVTATLDEALSITPDVVKLRLIRNLVGTQPPAAGGSDDDWYMWNGTAYERWIGIATVDATVTGVSVSATFSQEILSDWEDGNKMVVRPEFGVSRGTYIDDYYAVDIMRPSSYVAYPPETAGASTDMTAEFIPEVIGISVLPVSVDFGAVEPGVASDPQSVIVTNEGNVPEDFSTTIINESHPLVYSTGLALTWSLIPPESIAVLESVDVSLVLTVPLNTPFGTYTATLVFWAEIAP